MNDKETEQKFGELLDVMARLRSETGCPWDKEQTHLSLKPCLLEETYELLDAFDDGDPKKLKEELGDVLAPSHFSRADRRGGTAIYSERCYCSAHGKTHPPPSLCIRRRTDARRYGFGVEATAADQSQREKRSANRNRRSATCPKRCRHWPAPKASREEPRIWVSIGPTSNRSGERSKRKSAN